MDLTWIPSVAVLISLAGVGLAWWRIHINQRRIMESLRATIALEHAEAVNKKLDEISLGVRTFGIELRELNGTVRDHAQKLAVLTEKLSHKQDKKS